MTPVEAVEAVLQARSLSKRVAVALYALDQQWHTASKNLRDGVAAPVRLQTPDDEIVTFDEIDSQMWTWLYERRSRASLELLLEFLMTVDQLIAPFARNQRLFDVRPDGYPFGDDVLLLWIAPHGVPGVLRDQRSDPKMHQTTDYERKPDDYLTWIRYAIGTKGTRPVTLSAPLRPEIRRAFDALWNEEPLDLRIGLFSVRGDYAPRFTITGVANAVDAIRSVTVVMSTPVQAGSCGRSGSECRMAVVRANG